MLGKEIDIEHSKVKQSGVQYSAAQFNTPEHSVTYPQTADGVFHRITSEGFIKRTGDLG